MKQDLSEGMKFLLNMGCHHLMHSLSGFLQHMLFILYLSSKSIFVQNIYRELIFIFIFRLYHMNNNTIIENLSKFLIISSSLLMAVLVSISRVYLQYHTFWQVLCGALVGILFATFWFALTYLVLTPLFPQIVSW